MSDCRETKLNAPKLHPNWLARPRQSLSINTHHNQIVKQRDNLATVVGGFAAACEGITAQAHTGTQVVLFDNLNPSDKDIAPTILHRP
jgi:hypothetical protein